MKNGLKNGYYLSIYSEIDPIMSVMQFSLRHDHNMSLFRVNEENVELIHHWEFERITGMKHHRVAFYNKSDAIEFINGLLAEYELDISDMKGVIGIPQLSTCGDYHCLEEIPSISYHSICHMFSSVMVNSDIFYNENIIALAFDGGPDNLIDEFAYSKFLYAGAISIKGEMEFFQIPSPGAYWEYLRKEFNMQEGKLMALAYATTTRLKATEISLEDIYKITDCNEIFSNLKKYIDNLLYSEDMSLYVNYDKKFTLTENKISALMKLIQEKSIDNVYNLINKILTKHNLDPRDVYLSLAGGYALNCPTNTSLMQYFGFKGQLCCPCVNDGGISIGMALYYFYKKSKKFNFYLKTSYYATADYNLDYYLKKYELFIKDVFYGIDQAAEDIINEPVIWFEGRGEIGPRALGHRSLLGHPSQLIAKHKLNLYKQREWWRPIAPIIIEEELDNWFTKAFCSPFMLNNFYIKKDKEKYVQAVVHLDGTARVQTINEVDNAKLYKVLVDMKNKIGIPIMGNTSLNDRGEPIISTIDEAFNFALRKRIHVMYVNGVRIMLDSHEKYKLNEPLERQAYIFKKYKDDIKLLKKINPFGLSYQDLVIYKMNSDLHHYNIEIYDDVCVLNKVIGRIKKNIKYYSIYN